MHARVFGGAPLAEETVMGSFVDGARVRAGALIALAERIGSADLGAEVNALLVDHPLPLAGDGLAGVPALRAAYAAQERGRVDRRRARRLRSARPASGGRSCRRAGQARRRVLRKPAGVGEERGLPGGFELRKRGSTSVGRILRFARTRSYRPRG